ncbi:hypothetical protein CEUSTIGMA_g4855.t1 [Chlamydomonas eustigma]|uniref:Cytochrome b5 heme-binding domain-containing protein n=1 Tax=Chlamydomonas eustigma TaxID=1157962 RepID=A0A250X394_9CHLO|nr:hypothetical protein CEUSTIGMA_g4855.t1 [Chlamydomonas eustigma]|eukprot:GAX77409.1 hypothetical protein CEUSTIGMA_g4855.t1 [Chlamydomonas eustigma]
MCEKLCKVVSWKELSAHNKSNDLWVAIDGRAYDVTSWRLNHPGGLRLLEFYGGKDATEPFLAYHAGASSKIAAKFMAGMMVGNMEPNDISIQAKAFRKMAGIIEQTGLYKQNPAFYFLIYAYLAVTWIATCAFVCNQQILLATFTISIFWGQLAFVGHDLGHHCVHIKRTVSDRVGLLVTAFLGIGVSHWVDNHNAHHAVVNSSDCDPEVQFMPFIATSTLHFEHTRLNQTKLEQRLSSISKGLVSYQHLSFIPLLMFARYKFYAQSFGHWATGKLYIGRWSELVAQLFFFVWYIALTVQLPSWKQRVAWVLLSHASDWVLYLQTVITHFPREISPGVKMDWIESQAVGTLNWSCPAWLDWFHGGLQFQIEHHLFPRIPRHNLRRASLILRPFLQELGIEYHSPTFMGAIVETYYSLKKVAMEAQRVAPPALVQAATH